MPIKFALVALAGGTQVLTVSSLGTVYHYLSCSFKFALSNHNHKICQISVLDVFTCRRNAKKGTVGLSRLDHFVSLQSQLVSHTEHCSQLPHKLSA